MRKSTPLFIICIFQCFEVFSQQVFPDGLIEALFTAQTATQSITIENGSGDEELHWGISIDYLYPASLDTITQGTFVSLPASPAALTALVTDKAGNIYGQEYRGFRFFKYSVAEGKWVQLSSSTVNSDGPGGAALLDGKIYTSFSGSDKMGIYDIVNDSWSSLITSYYTESIASDGKYLYFVSAGRINRYDPVCNAFKFLSWTNSVYFQNASIVYHDGYLYGHTARRDIESEFARYDIANDTIEVLPSAPPGTIGGSTINTQDGKYYTRGLYGESILYEYDMSTQKWSTIEIPLFPLNYGGLVYHEGKFPGVYFIQGSFEVGFGMYAGALHQDWLSVGELTGTVPAGGSETIEVLFDSRGLYQDGFKASITVTDKSDSTVLKVMPITLDVTGAPEIELSEETIDFESLFVGALATDTITISNQGFETLSLSSIGVNNEDFSLSHNAMEISPGFSQDLIVQYAPSQILSHEATLSIVSNDPDEDLLFIGLLGNGTAPPEIAADQTGFSATLSTNDSFSYALPINNLSSEADLTWEASVQLVSTPVMNGERRSAANPISYLDRIDAEKALESRLFTVDVTGNAIHQLEANGEGRLNSFSPVSPNIINGGSNGLAFDGTSLYFISGFGRGDIYKYDPVTGEILDSKTFPTLNLDALAHSGTHLYGLDFEKSKIMKLDYKFRTVLDSISLGERVSGGMTFGGSRGTIFVSDGDKINEIDLNSLETVNSFRAPAPVFGLGYSDALGILFASSYEFDEVEVILALHPETGEELYQVSTEFSAALASDEGVSIDWLSISSLSGAVEKDGSEVLEITLSAPSNIAIGTYEALIYLDSDDPANPRLEIPVSIEVLDRLLSAEEDVSVAYPNPTSGVISVKSNDSTVNLRVYDVSGKEVDFTSTKQDGGYQLDISGNPKGIYFIESKDVGGDLRRYKVLLK